MSIKLGTPEQEKIWLTAWQSRPAVSACDANRLMFEEKLDELLQPLSVQNVVGIIDALDAVGRLASATGSAPALKAQPQVEAPAEVVAEPAEPETPDFRRMTVRELRNYLRQQKANRLPTSYSREVIQNMNRAQYERISIEYGSQQVRDRLAGKS